MANISELYNLAIEERADPRTKNWFLVHSPWPPLCIFITYVSICINAKTFMQNRKPMNLKSIIFVYNIALITSSAYMCYEFFMSAYLANYSLLCQPVDYSEAPLAMRIANVSYWYYISKYIELLDTAFFILRKKFNQVSFLHVYHHSTMLFNWWLQIKYIPGGQSFFIPLVNSFVHVVMYSYYALSSLGPHMQKYLWWKKYITKMQLIQFVMIFTYCTYNYFIVCDFPKWLDLLVMFYMVSLIILFLNFYVQAYLKKKTS